MEQSPSLGLPFLGQNPYLSSAPDPYFWTTSAPVQYPRHTSPVRLSSGKYLLTQPYFQDNCPPVLSFPDLDKRRIFFSHIDDKL